MQDRNGYPDPRRPEREPIHFPFMATFGALVVAAYLVYSGHNVKSDSGRAGLPEAFVVLGCLYLLIILNWATSANARRRERYQFLIAIPYWLFKLIGILGSVVFFICGGFLIVLPVAAVMSFLRN